MDGNVSKEGIRKDLEWMKRSGIGGFQQFDAGGINMPRAAKVKLPYLSEGWKDAFHFALGLADSLGMEVGIASAPGWSSTGGPWVTPSDAMKKLEWKSVDVKGGKVNIKLPELYRTVGPYQDFEVGNDRIKVEPYGDDLFVLAVKIPSYDKSMKEMGADVSVSDSIITCRFKKPQTIKALTLQSYEMAGRPRSGETQCKNVLESSDDGVHWEKVRGILPARIPYTTVDIEPVKAKHFRVKGERLVSLELFTVTKVNHSQELGGFSIAFDFNKFHTPATKDPIKPSDIINLTGKMSPDGKLECVLPSGRWRIYRFGYSITGKINHPASPEATGLEVDKLNPYAWMRYFRNYLDVYKEASGGLMGKKGIRYLLVDSYEAGSMTWTHKIVEEFKSRRGYDLIPWLPVLTGEVVESSAKSEKFLWDWRKTLGELFEENYNRINEIVNEYDLDGRYTESHEGGRAYVGDGMEVKRTATVPMAAIWMENTYTGSRIPAAIADIKESASVAHIFGQNLVAAESFTVDGNKGRAYTYCPENMKYVADVALSAGLNRFVIHESASQPSDEYLPGMQLFGYGQWFHRNETWGEYARPFTDYLARSCQMLQQGRAVCDILLYYGEDSNATAQYGGDSFDLLPRIPSGHDYDFANPYILLNSVSPVNGELVTSTGMRYKVLWMDKNHETMSLEILRRIKELADEGIVIRAEEPSFSGGLLADEKEFSSLVESVWRTGRKNIVSDLPEALSIAGAGPDVTGIGSDFRYIHRRMNDGTEIYWVRNFSGKDVNASLSFRSGGKNASLFNPENGKISAIQTSFNDGRYAVSLPMLSTDAVFIVFSDSPLTSERFTCETFTPLKDIHGEWNATFSQKGGGTANEVFSDLESWTERSNPIVKYFSGTAVYKTSFTLSSEDLAGDSSVALDLGEVKNIADVFVNGEPAGVLWKAPFRTDDIKPLLKAGENTLEIKVTNVWRNRMIGDVQKGEDHPVTAIRRFYKADDPVLPSGLLGPVRLLTYKP